MTFRMTQKNLNQEEKKIDTNESNNLDTHDKSDKKKHKKTSQKHKKDKSAKHTPGETDAQTDTDTESKPKKKKARKHSRVMHDEKEHWVHDAVNQVLKSGSLTYTNEKDEKDEDRRGKETENNTKTKNRRKSSIRRKSFHLDSSDPETSEIHEKHTRRRSSEKKDHDKEHPDEEIKNNTRTKNRRKSSVGPETSETHTKKTRRRSSHKEYYNKEHPHEEIENNTKTKNRRKSSANSETLGMQEYNTKRRSIHKSKSKTSVKSTDSDSKNNEKISFKQKRSTSFDFYKGPELGTVSMKSDDDHDSGYEVTVNRGGKPRTYKVNLGGLKKKVMVNQTVSPIVNSEPATIPSILSKVASVDYPPPSTQPPPPSVQSARPSIEPHPPSVQPPSDMHPPPTVQYPPPSVQYRPPSVQYPPSSVQYPPPGIQPPPPVWPYPNQMVPQGNTMPHNPGHYYGPIDPQTFSNSSKYSDGQTWSQFGPQQEIIEAPRFRPKRSSRSTVASTGGLSYLSNAPPVCRRFVAEIQIQRIIFIVLAILGVVLLVTLLYMDDGAIIPSTFHGQGKSAKGGYKSSKSNVARPKISHRKP